MKTKMRASCAPVIAAGVVGFYCLESRGQTFTGAANTDWNNPANWSTNPNLPLNNGTANIVFNAVGGNNLTNQNIAAVFDLASLTFGANANNINISNNSLRFNNAASIVNNRNDDVHVIHSNIILNANLTFSGLANRTNADTLLIVEGQITQIGGARSLTINMTNNADVILGHANNTYTGQTDLARGNLVLGGNGSIGSGPLNVAGNQGAASVRARHGTDVVLANTVAVNISRDMSFGDVNNTGTTGSIRINGTTTIGGNFPRTINLAGGTRHTLRFGGAIASQGDVRFVGDAAPQVNAAKAAFTNPRNPNYGSLVEILNTSNSAGFRGGVTILNGTLRHNGVLGAAGTPMLGNIVVGDGTNAAALIGTGRFWLDKTTFIQPGGRPGARLIVNKGSITRAGNSPGQMFIDGGGVTFHGGSYFGVDIGGPPPVTPFDPVGCSQLVIEDGDLDLLFELGERPYLGVSVLPDSYVPQVGDMFMIIDIRSSLVPRVDLPNLSNPYNTSPNLFSAPDGSTLLNGSQFVADGFTFRILYNGGDGNDIVLEVMAIPAPASFGLLAIAGLAASRRRRA